MFGEIKHTLRSVQPARSPAFIPPTGRLYGILFSQCKVHLLISERGEARLQKYSFRSLLALAFSHAHFPLRYNGGLTFYSIGMHLSIVLIPSFSLPSPFPTLQPLFQLELRSVGRFVCSIDQSSPHRIPASWSQRPATTANRRQC